MSRSKQTFQILVQILVFYILPYLPYTIPIECLFDKRFAKIFESEIKFNARPIKCFHPNVHYQSKALLEDPHLNVVIIMSFQNKK